MCASPRPASTSSTATLGVTRSGKFPQVGAEAAVGSGRTPPADAADSVRVDCVRVLGNRPLRTTAPAHRSKPRGSAGQRRRPALRGAHARCRRWPRHTSRLLGIDSQLDIAKRTLVSREKALRIFEARYRRGATSEFELSQSRSEYAVTKSTIPPLEQAQAQIENALALLLGRNPGPVARNKSLAALGLPERTCRPSFGDPRAPAGHQAGRAESHRRECTHRRREGAVLPEHFPDRALRQPEQLVRHAVHQTGGALQLWRCGYRKPIFTGGGISGQVSAAEARQQQTLFAYQRAIRTAFRRCRGRVDCQPEVARGAGRAGRARGGDARLRAAGQPALRQRLFGLPRGARCRARPVLRRTRLHAGKERHLLRAGGSLQDDGRRLGGRCRGTRGKASRRHGSKIPNSFP